MRGTKLGRRKGWAALGGRADRVQEEPITDQACSIGEDGRGGHEPTLISSLAVIGAASFLLISGVLTATIAQVSAPEVLISGLDSALFSAINAHDAAALGAWFTPDPEFCHDKTGLAGYDSTMAGFAPLINRPATADMRRDIGPSTL